MSKDKRYYTLPDDVLQHIFSNRVVIFDLEATCSIDRSIPFETIEIGAVDTDLNTFSSFVKPEITPTLTDFCKNLTTITQEDVDQADYFNEVYPLFETFVDGDTLLSWGDYDKNQLKRDFERHGMNKTFTHYNLKNVYYNIIGSKPKGMDMELNNLGLTLDGTHHRGIDDAKNILKIYETLKYLFYNEHS